MAPRLSYVSEEGDGAFAVVDVDTLWRNRADGRLFPVRKAVRLRGPFVPGYLPCTARTRQLDLVAPADGEE